MECSLYVIDGVDKGRNYVNLTTPFTIGREEGNRVRLNDDRVSRFHAKVQEDQGQIVLTDLDSTNGTRVNGEAIQLRLLRPGDRVSIGRSTLVFGSLEEIAASLKADPSLGVTPTAGLSSQEESGAGYLTDISASEADLNIDTEDRVDVFHRAPPPLPNRLTPAQAAQLSEVIDFLHRALADATEPIHLPPRAKEARLPLANWQRVQAVLSFLARYSRQVAEPDEPRKASG